MNGAPALFRPPATALLAVRGRAVEACKRLRRADVFAKARRALTWIREDRARFVALQKGAAFLQSLRGR